MIRNVNDSELLQAKVLAIQEADPNIPTLCFIEIPHEFSEPTTRRDANSQEKNISIYTSSQGAIRYDGPKEEID
jgi:hypothetical protein